MPLAERTRKIGLVLVVVVISFAACTKTPYVYHTSLDAVPSLQRSPSIIQPTPESPEDQTKPGEPMFVRGESYAVLDKGASWTFGLLPKFLLWNTSVERHEISPETEAAIVSYVEKNNLHDVKVRLNQYDPLGEWSRLWNNSSVGGLWRATFGTFTMLVYTILPGRLFGGDSYNPFTNTISLYSDHPAIALHEAGHAKDFASTEWKGLYAVSGMLPLVSLYSESEATGDVLGYLEANQCFQEKADAYKVLYPAYATYIGGEFAGLLMPSSPLNPLVSVAFVIPAHIVGRINASQVQPSPNPH